MTGIALLCALLAVGAVAPEYVLGSEFAPLRKRTEYYAEKGCRVLLLAQCDGAEEGRLLFLARYRASTAAKWSKIRSKVI